MATCSFDSILGLGNRSEIIQSYRPVISHFDDSNQSRSRYKSYYYFGRHFERVIWVSYLREHKGAYNYIWCSNLGSNGVLAIFPPLSL